MRFGAASLFVLFGAHSALGFPSSRLVYVRGPGAENCPDRDSVREAVKKRLGYDPFFPNSDKTIIARVVREADKLRGEVELVDEHGTQAGKREFSAEQGQCDQLVHAMALSISIAIDPKSAETYGQGPADAPAPNPAEKALDSPPEPEPAPTPPTPVLPSESPRTALRAQPSAKKWLWSAGLGATVQFGSMPEAALGATAFAALRTGAWSLALEGELDAPVTSEQQGVELRNKSGALKLLPCGHWRLLKACQLTVLRWLTATGKASGLGGTAGSLALGARVGFELPLSPTFGALAYGDLLLTPLPVSLVSEQSELWKTPIVSGGLGIAAVVHF
ncbi:MAG TPA: hypothetical protein VHM25_11250 [Polyangiaceae bacterium]|nr:hypothetical protein [Polyangiaceae bacterium]